MSMHDIRAQHAEINKLNKTFGSAFSVLKGIEANILQDGSLDMHPAELQEFDLVVASPHSLLRKTIDQTERMLAVEIDGDVSRQDLDFRIATAAKKAGCVFALDSDAHAVDQLWMADYALAHARLAGISKERTVNCWPIERILEWARTFRPCRRLTPKAR